MENYLKTLNEKQLEAVTTTNQYVRIIAGAGSGKTKVLTTRIAYLINEWGISAESILAITFTNKAANEMKVRIESMLQGMALGSHVSTIHSFCVMLLRAEIRREDYPTNFTILDQDDQKSIIKEALKEYGLTVKDYNLNSCLDYIANNKTAGIAPKHALETAYNLHYEFMAKIYNYYLERCQQLYALDFDDLLLWSNKILRKYPDVRKKWQNKYRFILVDEFQDIDNVQNELISLLASEDTYLYVVGDPDQTIYTWRGADINIIMGFDKLYQNVKTIILDKNYRSTQNILNGANSLIKYNKNRVKKDLFTENEEGSKILHYTATTDEHEAYFVVNKLNSLVHKGSSYRDSAILYRSSYLSRPMEKQLMDLKIPYVIYGGIRFFERAEVKDMLSYLRLITVKDDLSFKRVVNVPKRSIGEKSVDALFDTARKMRMSLMDAIEYFDGSSKIKEKLEQFRDMILDWRSRASEMSLEQIFQMVYDESGYKDMLKNSDDPKDEERLDNVNELLNDVISYQNAHPEYTLDDYLANVALYLDIQDNNNGDYLSLMTIHAAKGLEFDNVFVIGMSEGIFPSERSTQESGVKGMEEERRLAYVAFTRARKNLVLTDNNGYSFAAQGNKYTSRFVSEIDSEYIEDSGMDSKPRSTSNTPTISLSQVPTTKTKTKYSVGELVVHDVFGEGVILSINEKNIGDIAFGYPYMTKKVALDFPKLHKKESA